MRLLMVASSADAEQVQGALLNRVRAKVDCQRLNLGLVLSQRLLDVPARQRALQTPQILTDLLTGSGNLLVDHIELLFDPTLQIDPLRVLKAASRRRSLIVIWPGALTEGGHLVYAEPGHPEYRRYDSADLADVTVVDVSALRWEE